jgi:mRNA interferase MazF
MPTKSTIIYKKWDIVLVNFPFSDLTASKKRPALIISPDEYNKSEDVIIAFITSNLPEKTGRYEYYINEWQNSGLLKTSILKMKLATVTKLVIHKKLGTLHTTDQKAFFKTNH